CQTALLVPAPALLRPGFASLLRSPRDEGWAERRETFGCCASAPIGRARNAARQAPSEAPCVPSRGTLASRRSTVSVLGSGAALVSPLPPFRRAVHRSQRTPPTQAGLPSGRLHRLPSRR